MKSYLVLLALLCVNLASFRDCVDYYGWEACWDDYYFQCIDCCKKQGNKGCKNYCYQQLKHNY